MKSVDTTLFHRVLAPHQSGATIHPTIIYLHGRGADEEDLLGLSGFFDDRFLSISVRAPHVFEYGGFTWYEILELGKPEPRMFNDAYEKLSQFIHDIQSAYPIDPKRLFLFGFSMGTVMAYALALTYPQLFAGVVANSGYLAEQTRLTYDWNAMKGKPVFITHGRNDPVIPLAAAQRAYKLFLSAAADVQYRDYDAGHELSERCVADVAAWLQQQLDMTT